jgi:ABC-2 type transport system ATP-binding protein
MNALLTVDGITKQFNKRRVLDDVRFTVLEGEVLGLIGPNGSGKTTLFECLAGLMPVNAGRLTFHGKPVDAARRKQGLFYLPDGISPWSEQTVAWEINFFAQLFARSHSYTNTLVEQLHLETLLKSRVSSLSKGERKRLLLALGMLTTQPLLLLDEPFDGLDLRQTHDVMKLIREHTNSGRTLMLSIHQLIDAGRVCDRLVLLNNGRVAAEGTLPDLRTRTNLPKAGVEEIFLALT